MFQCFWRSENACMPKLWNDLIAYSVVQFIKAKNSVSHAVIELYTTSDPVQGEG